MLCGCNNFKLILYVVEDVYSQIFCRLDAYLLLDFLYYMLQYYVVTGILLYYISRLFIFSTKLHFASIIDDRKKGLILALIYTYKRDIANKLPNGTYLIVVWTIFTCTQKSLP